MQTAAERTVQQDIKETSLARVRVHFPLRNFYARCLWIKARHTTHSKAAFPGRFLFPAAGQGKEGGSFDGDCIFLSSRWKMLRRNRPVFLSSNSRNRKPSTLNSRNHRKKTGVNASERKFPNCYRRFFAILLFPHSHSRSSWKQHAANSIRV